MAALATKDVKIAGVRIAPQCMLDLERQAVHAAPHVGVANRQPHPHARRHRDHRRDSALRTAAAKSAGTDPGIRTRTWPSSTSIAGAAQGGAPVGSGLSAGAIRTCAN